jgi:hypothetical protein
MKGRWPDLPATDMFPNISGHTKGYDKMQHITEGQARQDCLENADFEFDLQDSYRKMPTAALSAPVYSRKTKDI